MNFFTLGTRGKYPKQITDLKAKSGVYVIRQDGAIRYIGESHTGRLKKTLLRHFQHWTGPTKGPTFPRSKVEVAVFVTRPANAVEFQNALIGEYAPELNVVAQKTWWERFWA